MQFSFYLVFPAMVRINFYSFIINMTDSFQVGLISNMSGACYETVGATQLRGQELFTVSIVTYALNYLLRKTSNGVLR